jgi:N-hydroxyarylamine O-acetyltransferase
MSGPGLIVRVIVIAAIWKRLCGYPEEADGSRTVVAYLDRVGVPGPAASDAAGLRALHRAHQLTVPFENLSIHLAEPIYAG